MAQSTSSPDNDHAHPTPSTPRPFWFEDGSVIISVGKEHFKLHKSFVDRHSTLLAALPASRFDDEDIPHVEIPSDLTDVKDFTALLGHLYHDAYVRPPTSSV